MVKIREPSGLRSGAMKALRQALIAADPVEIFKHQVKRTGKRLHVSGVSGTIDLSSFDSVLVIGGGKASASMAFATEKVLGRYLSGGSINIPKYSRPK